VELTHRRRVLHETGVVTARLQLLGSLAADFGQVDPTVDVGGGRALPALRDPTLRYLLRWGVVAPLWLRIINPLIL
jgi:hypothetical protein